MKPTVIISDGKGGGLMSSKFNPKTDKSRPKVNSIVEQQGRTFKVKKVDWWEMKRIVAGEQPDMTGYDEVLVKQHPERPFVLWLCWCKEVKDNNKKKKNVATKRKTVRKSKV